MTKITRPALRYHGGKWNVAPWIIGHFVPHVTYVEPFVGAASVFLRKQPSELEVLNDLDGNIVNFFKVLRNRPDELIRAIRLTPYSRQEHGLACTYAGQDELEQARCTYIKAWQSFGGYSKRIRAWSRNVTNNSYSAQIISWNKTDCLYPIAERFKDAQIEHRSALDVIAQFDTPKTLFYVDPPYLAETRSSNDGYFHEMDHEEHAKFLELLKSLRGMVILSGYPNDLYDSALTGWTKRERLFQVGTGKRSGHECLWLNPAVTSLTALPLFASGEIKETDRYRK